MQQSQTFCLPLPRMCTCPNVGRRRFRVQAQRFARMQAALEKGMLDIELEVSHLRRAHAKLLRLAARRQADLATNERRLAVRLRFARAVADPADFPEEYRDFL